MDVKFWLDKKVLITGCTGFKGSWLTTWLHMLGAQVYGYSLPAPTNPSMWEDLQLEKFLQKMCYADIRDYAQLNQFIQESQPEIIIHMAAQPLVRYSYANPRETYEVNVMGTVNLLDCVRHVDCVRAVVNVTTDKCYENKEWVWPYRENEPMGGHDPYSSSKGCSELVTAAFIKSYFNLPGSATAIASARAGNVIGGGDWAIDRLIPDIIRSFSQDKEVVIRHPQAVRPWQHVLEPLSGYMTLAEKLYMEGSSFSGGWNFGPLDTDVKTVEQVVTQMCELWGDGASWVKDHDITHPHEANLLRLDCSKARTILDWQPLWNSDTTLSKLITWYKAHAQKQSMEQVLDLTQQQITEYMKATETSSRRRTGSSLME